MADRYIVTEDGKFYVTGDVIDDDIFEMYSSGVISMVLRLNNGKIESAEVSEDECGTVWEVPKRM